MKPVAVAAVLVGLLLAVRVMFFGVQRRLDENHLLHRRWPFALAAFLVVGGTFLYAISSAARTGVTPMWLGVVVATAAVVGGGAWWLVKRSASIPSTDPDDDPRYRFQGHVARVIEPIAGVGSQGAPTSASGRIAFNFDGRRYELRARWSAASPMNPSRTPEIEGEVVIDRVEDDVAYVEPWAAVEGRL